MRSRFSRGQHLAIERADGRTKMGQFVREDEQYVVIKGTVGGDIGREISIPRAVIMGITVTHTERPDAF